MNRLHVLLTLEGLHVGGTETHVITLAKELIRKGVDVSILSLGGGKLLKEFQSISCPLYIFEDSYEALNRVKMIINEHNISLVHSHDTSAIFINKVCKQLNIPHFYTVHGTYYNFFHELDLSITTIFSISPTVQQWLSDQGIPSYRLPLCMNPEKFRYIENSMVRNELSILPEAPVVLYAARLGDEVKAEIGRKVLSACNRLRREEFSDLKVVLVGGSAFEDRLVPLKQFVNQLNLNSGHFIHMLGERNDMPEVYSIADCVVGTGTVAVEAMACERVLIGAGARGYIGIVGQDNYGYAYNQNYGDHAGYEAVTEEKLYRDIRTILSQSKSNSNLGKEHRLFVIERHNCMNMAKEVYRLYLSRLT